MYDPEIEELFDALLADFKAINTMHGDDNLTAEEADEATLHRLHAEWREPSDEADAEASRAILIAPNQNDD